MLRLYSNLSGHTLYSIEQRDKERRISLIPQKNFLFEITLNLQFVFYGLLSYQVKNNLSKATINLICVSPSLLQNQ